MAVKSKANGKTRKLSIKQGGYSDKKQRTKSLYLRGSVWVLRYWTSDLKRTQISCDTSDLDEAVEFMHGFSPHLPLPLQKTHKIEENQEDKFTEDQVKDQPNAKLRSLREAWEVTLSALETGALQTPTLETYRESTLNNLRYTMRKFLRFVEASTFSDAKLWSRENEKALQSFFDLFLDSLTVSVTTKRNYKRDVSIILSLMVEHGAIQHNPLFYRSKKTKRTQSEKAQKKHDYTVFSIDEFERIVNAMDADLDKPGIEGVWLKYLHSLQRDVRDMTVVAFATGMRISEITHLRWENVRLGDDPEQRWIFVRAESDGSWAPKTQASVRDIPLPDGEVLRILQRRYAGFQYTLERSGAERTDTHVFAMGSRRRDGVPSVYTKDYISHKFKSYVTRVFGESDKRHFHSLRHSIISLWVNGDPHGRVQQLSIYQAQDIAGHTSSAVTETYRHSNTEMIKREAMKVEIKLERPDLLKTFAPKS